jgi:hypothetical protein
MKNIKRTDPHRKGAIVPGNYSYVLSYFTGGADEPALGVKDIVEMRQNGAKFSDNGGSIGKCAACGAWFKEGDVWYHEPTGEHIHLGHDCADKYGMMVDRSAFELELGRHRAAAAVIIQRKINDEKRQAFLDATPSLAEDFALKDKHNIIANIYDSFVSWCSISEKQIALVHKLAEEIRNPAPKEAELCLVTPPEGRVAVEGDVVGTKVVDTQFGSAVKMLVLVTLPSGSVYKLWGTAPSSLLGDKPLKGNKVSFTATVTPKELGFGFFSRPAKAAFVEAATP